MAFFTRQFYHKDTEPLYFDKKPDETWNTRWDMKHKMRHETQDETWVTG